MAVRNVAGLILYNDQNQVLLQHRSEDAPRSPGYWGFFGGGIEEGETPEQALARELVEELEYRVSAPRLVLTQKFMHGEDENTKYIFIEKYVPGTKFTQHEGQGMGWWGFEDMSNLLISDHDRIALSKIKGILNA